jgi:hypothetical protein
MTTVVRKAVLSVASPILLCLGVAALFPPSAAAQQPITPVPLMPFGDGQDSVLVAPLRYQIGRSAFIITVPEGFVTDFASTPRAIWAIFLRQVVTSSPPLCTTSCIGIRAARANKRTTCFARRWPRAR